MPKRPPRNARVPIVVAIFFGFASAAFGAAGPGADPSGTDGAARLDYRAIFGERYARAERYLADNPWMAEALRLPPDETAVALAVVFPEIVRFSYLEDRIQVETLKALYVRSGRESVNFSVGRFQMKPAFVEHLEAEWNGMTGPEEKAAAGIPAFDLRDEPPVRAARVLRLDDARGQVDYLRMFMAVMKKRYGAVAFADAEERVRFYATAYNAGFASGEARIRRAMREKAFHLEIFSPKRTYSYADVAAFYWRMSRARRREERR